MLLRVVVTPQFGQTDGRELLLNAALGGHGFRPRLVDTANLKEYAPLGGDIATWASHGLVTTTVNRSPVEVWAYFAAPQDDIRTVDVRISDALPALDDVPITR